MAGRSETKRFLFSKASLAKTTTPKAGRVYVYDARVTGLCLCITASGLQTFYSYKKVEGRPVRVRLGRYPGITIQQARSLAADVAVDIARGGNPQKRRQEVREELTFGDLCTHFMDYAQSHKRTWEEDQRKIDKYITTWQHRKASAITKQAVISLHTSIGTRNGHYMANRVLALICSVFAKAIADDLFEDRNPASSIKKFEERSRDRYLLPDELPRFFQSLKDYPDETLRDFFLVALLTGARRGNVLAMHWDDVNLDMRVWRIPDTKNREPVLVEKHWDTIEHIANYLCIKKTLHEEDIQTLLNGGSLADAREPERIAASTRGERFVSPMRAGASVIFNIPIGHGFPADVMREHGVKIMSNVERDAILNEHHRIMGLPVARIAAIKKPRVSPRLAAARAEGRRLWKKGRAIHAAR